MKIAIISGSIREGRKSLDVATWVKEHADARGSEATYEIVDLKEFNVPLLTAETVPGAANKQYDDPNVTAWSQAIDSYDAFIFVTPEYNHGVPGAFKNAFDTLGAEWAGKAVGFVAYGAVGGVRAIENWRTVIANFSMVGVRAEVNLSLFSDFENMTTFTPGPHHTDLLASVFDQVEQTAAQLAK